MNDQFSRTVNLFGQDKYELIKRKKIIVFGVGGVGSSAVEALVRFGFESITIVDYDRVDETNLNRQIFSNRSNIGMLKCLTMKERIKSINPDIKINYYIKRVSFSFEKFNLKEYDYVIDAIDSVGAKINLIDYCNKESIPIISSMGTGNRIDTSKLKVMDIFETKNDPLSKVIRRELRKRGISKQKVISSIELPRVKSKRENGARKSSPLSVSYVPPVAGYIMVSEIIKEIMEQTYE